MRKPLFLFLISITLIIVIGCTDEDDDSVVSSGTSIGVLKVFPSDASTDVPLSTSIYVTFNQTIEPTSITATTTGTACYGEIQVSKDSFSTCLKFITSPTPSNENTTYTVKPFSNLEVFTAYKLKIRYKYGQDNQGNPLTRERTSEFTTGEASLLAGSGFAVSPISGNTSEDGAQASFDIALQSQPTNEVTLPVSSSDTTEGTITITELTFDSLNWNTTQTVTVTGVDDSDIDGNQDYIIVLGVASSSDTAFDGLDPDDVSLTNLENEVLQITNFQFLAANNTDLTLDAWVTINQIDKTISAHLPVGSTVVIALIPTIIVNTGSVTPLSGMAQDFTNPIKYSVSLGGLTTQEYTISLNGPVSLPDTQQTLCYDTFGVDLEPCPSANDVMAQDGTYQTDPSPRFTAGSGSTAGTVMDNQTGLVWEQGNSAINGTPTHTWADAPNYCASLNSAPLGGYAGWRLPSRTELYGIVKHEGLRPNINHVFTGTVWDFYWTSTPYALDPSYAWSVTFNTYGYVTDVSKASSYYVRCCVDLFEQAHNLALTDNGDQTISDPNTKLMWQKCSYGQSGNDCSGSAMPAGWADSISYCETQIGTSGTFAGYGDWRLPNINELVSIVDDTKGTGPLIDIAKFPGTGSSYYWSSTNYSSSALRVWFNDGNVTISSKSDSNYNYIRCVR